MTGARFGGAPYCISRRLSRLSRLCCPEIQRPRISDTVLDHPACDLLRVTYPREELIPNLRDSFKRVAERGDKATTAQRMLRAVQPAARATFGNPVESIDHMGTDSCNVEVQPAATIWIAGLPE